MKVGIFTQPLKQNYGCLLQNFALQTVLKRLGHDVITLDNDNWRPPTLSRAVDFFLRKLGVRKSQPTVFSKFVDKHIVRTSGKPVTFRQLRSGYRRLNPDVMIVGSDQVWRPKYNYDIRFAFLSFVDCKKIAYAASFGVDNWEFIPQETLDCQGLLKKFSAVSVREKSAIQLCEAYLKCDTAKLVLDPTLLLHESCYPAADTYKFTTPFVFTYILDWSEFKGSVIRNYIQEKKLKEVWSLYCSDGTKIASPLSPEDWLSGIKYADFVICDSFHGIAFSLIYNIDFIALLNPERGNSRIESILEQFNLTNRIVTSVEDLKKLNNIDWNSVNSQRDKLINQSIDFLKVSIRW